MPYKDKEIAKEKSRERMRKHRSVTPSDVTPENVTPFKYQKDNFMEYKNYEYFEVEGKVYSSKEYMLLVDGQVHKRKAKVPVIPRKVKISGFETKEGWCRIPKHQFISCMEACNRANEWRGSLDSRILDRFKFDYS